MLDAALKELSPRFARLYAKTGRPSIPREKLLRALLLQVLYSVRSERQLIEQLDYNLLFRWFVGLPMDAPVWDPTVFTKNRERLLQGDIAQAFFARVLDQARARALLSAEHFTVDGPLVEAWASQKSFKRTTAPRGRRPMIPAIPRWTSAASGARTRPTCRRPTPRPASRRRVPATPPSWPTTATS
jgi:transposase